MMGTVVHQLAGRPSASQGGADASWAVAMRIGELLLLQHRAASLCDAERVPSGVQCESGSSTHSPAPREDRFPSQKMPFATVIMML